MVDLSYDWIYEAFDNVDAERTQQREESTRVLDAFEAFEARMSKSAKLDGFRRIEMCRQALESLDRQGWQRSFHQRMFHEHFIRACSRIFFKTEPDGTFQRAHQAILDVNGWDTLSQEILISTPRRFGKTISVSMFAAAMVYSAAAVELSIYSTCKRISQKLLRNIEKFLRMIYKGLDVRPYRVLRHNMEELVLQGPDGDADVRVVNSYPSKVGVASPLAHEVLGLKVATSSARLDRDRITPSARPDGERATGLGGGVGASVDPRLGKVSSLIVLPCVCVSYSSSSSKTPAVVECASAARRACVRISTSVIPLLLRSSSLNAATSLSSMRAMKARIVWNTGIVLLWWRSVILAHFIICIAVFGHLARTHARGDNARDQARRRPDGHQHLVHQASQHVCTRHPHVQSQL